MGKFDKFFDYSKVFSGRIVRHSKVNILTSDFNNDGEPFTIFIKPKVVTSNVSIVLDVSLIKEDDTIHTECPFVLNQWSPCILTSIKANASVLIDYDIYIGMGR